MPKLVDLLDAIAPENLINYRYVETNQTANKIKTKGTCTFHERTLTKWNTQLLFLGDSILNDFLENIS